MPFPLYRIIFFLLFFVFEPTVLSSSEYLDLDYAYIGQWPAPGARHFHRHYTRNRLRRTTQPTIQPESDFASTFLGEFLQFFLIASPTSAQQTLSLSSSWQTELKEGQKECEICFEAVDLDDFHRCCTNGHLLHSRCFSTLLDSLNVNLHKCPLCREALHADPRQLQRLITNTPPEDDTWDILVNHLRILRLIKTKQFHDLNWNLTFHYLLTESHPEHLSRFLELNLVDVNASLDLPSEGKSCAITLILREILLNQNDHNRVERLHFTLQILLNHPKIILNRLDGLSPKHLIYHAIDSNVFEAFLHILDASPEIDLAAIFRYVCSISNRDIFFNYLLTCNSFDLFASDIINCSALHAAIRHNQNTYTSALLESPNIKTRHLLQKDNQNGRSALHYAMTFSEDSIIDKMLKFPNINWDLKDSSGYSINDLYINRMNDHY